MARPLRLDLDQEHLAAGPGETARLTLTLRNTSDVVEHLQIEVRGLPAGARVQADPPTVKLLPGATTQCSLTLELPADPPAPAGPHVLGVLARSRHHREVSRCEEARLDVPALPALAVTVEPELVRTGGRARFTATLVNEGNSRLDVALGGTDPERQVQFHFSPPELTLRPGHAAPVAVTVAAARPWTGQEARRPLTLTADAGDVRAAQTVTLVQPPRLAPVVLRSLAGVVGLLLVGGALVLADQLQEPAPAGADGAADAQEERPSENGTGSEPAETPTPSVSPTSAGPSPTEEPPPSPTPTPSATAPSTAPPASPSPLRTVLLTDGQDSPPLRRYGEVTRPGFDVLAAPATGEAAAACAAAGLAVHEAGETDFVTAVDPVDDSRCQDVALTVRFLEDVQPVTDVVLQVVAAGDYTVVVETDGGATKPVPARPQDGRITAVAGERVRSLTLSPDRAGSPPEQVGLVQVQYRQAAR